VLSTTKFTKDTKESGTQEDCFSSLISLIEY